ncbi:MAG: ABC transporter permease [Ilumatobacteraceae bacterium]
MSTPAPLPIEHASKSLLGKITTPASNPGVKRSLVTLASSIVAVLIALVISGILLQVTGKDALTAYQKIIETGTQGDKLLEMLQRATPLMLSAVAVAIGFKMNLFNIGVEGQYLFAALIAAVVGAELSLPAPLHVAVILIVAMAAGAFWAGIAAVLKVKRGVNEVIATIMLNYIALSVIQWLFDSFFRDDSVSGLNVKTKLIPTSGWMPNMFDGRLNSMLIVALAVVFAYWVLVFKSRFGFRLRASGLNGVAARTAGISSNQMIVLAILISGAVAGLIAMPSVLGEIHAYGQGVPDGLGFAGIAVALLGRNHPAGIVLAAMLFGFLDSTAGALQLAKIPNSILDVIQAIIVLTVVIVNEAVTRSMNKRTANQTARELEGAAPTAATLPEAVTA